MRLPPAGDVHVWRFPLTADAARLARLERVLSADERARARRLRLAPARHRFIIARAVYRHILARYAGVSPAALPLTAVHGEKPQSPAVLCAHNLSHAHELALVAVAAGGELGVDVDYVDRPLDVAAVARAAMTPREYAGWEGLPDALRRPAFFSLWTRKEAVLKAIGDRTAFEFRDLDLDTAARTWRIVTFVPAEGYCAAIAARSAGPRLAAEHHRHSHPAELPELRRLRLLDYDDDDRLDVRGQASGALQLADGAPDFVQ